jgi:hypothetical protein
MRGHRTVTWVLGAYKGQGWWRDKAYRTHTGFSAIFTDVRMGTVVGCIELRLVENGSPL